MKQNEKFVITINRELGSGGRTIGEKLAKRLGVPFYDKALIQGLQDKYSLTTEKIGTGWYFGFCLTYIFTFRFFIEYTKEIQEAFEASLPIDMGQILSIPFIILGTYCMIRAKNK